MATPLPFGVVSEFHLGVRPTPVADSREKSPSPVGVGIALFTFLGLDRTLPKILALKLRFAPTSELWPWVVGPLYLLYVALGIGSADTSSINFKPMGGTLEFAPVGVVLGVVVLL